ncbi:MAG: maeA 2 [Gammaproteobacteria bacterium]|nr:maeA 2 [Gammaproteobacteria bacterium]
MDYQLDTDQTGKPYLKIKLTDFALISHALLNKGTAFPFEERKAFGLIGLLPPSETNLAIQRARSFETFKSKTSDIEKYIYLRDLQDSNETLFYSLMQEHITELMPIIYTPIVGLGCQRYSHIYRRPRGVFISYPDRDHIEKILSNPRFDEVQVIVVSDGERILGLGDQGAGGMGIPIGKLALYTACAGIPPTATLPILLDTGTNHPELQKDPLYIGWQHERIRGQEYTAFLDTFVTAIKNRFPNALLQWEDFAQENANSLLERYRDQLCTFNDDIQGTAAVAAGALFSAIHVIDGRLRDQRIAVLGAGSAGCGISQLIMQAMIEDGLPPQEAKSRFFLIDRFGVLFDDMPNLSHFQRPFAQSKGTISTWQYDHDNALSLKEVVKNFHPTVLIGVSGQPRAFTEEIVREMANYIKQPVIFPLSNPTSHSEADPADLMNWTHGKAIIGTGSPFADIIKEGKSWRVDQTNNCYIFPGMGLGLVAVKSRRVTEKMFMVAAKALADCSPAKIDPKANLLPPLTEIRHVSLQVAIAVAQEAIKEGLADFTDYTDLEAHIRKIMWVPEYLPYKKW